MCKRGQIPLCIRQINKILSEFPLHSGGNMTNSGLFAQFTSSSVTTSANSYGSAFNLLFSSFNIRSVLIVAIVCGISSTTFSLRINSSSISNRPISSGSFFIRLLFNNNRLNLFNLPSSLGIVAILLNDALSSL
jgi:hypothetical protein